MSTVSETLSPISGLNVHYRQSISPSHMKGSFVGDDTNNHDFRFEARGKSVVNFSIDNPCNQALTWTVYGMHEADGDVGDAGTFQLESDSIAAASKDANSFVNYGFPYYLLRIVHAGTPTDDPLVSVSVYANAEQG